MAGLLNTVNEVEAKLRKVSAMLDSTAAPKTIMDESAPVMPMRKMRPDSGRHLMRDPETPLG